MAKEGRPRKRFQTVRQGEIPHARNGKHHQLMKEILADLDQLQDGSALKIPLKELPFSKEKVRSALNRVTRKADRSVATASDDKFLYVWNTGPQRA